MQPLFIYCTTELVVFLKFAMSLKAHDHLQDPPYHHYHPILEKRPPTRSERKAYLSINLFYLYAINLSETTLKEHRCYYGNNQTK